MANDTSNYPDFVFIAYYEDAHEETHDFAVSMEAGSLVGTPLKYIRHDLNTRPAAPVDGFRRLSLVRGGGLEDSKDGDYVRFDQVEPIIAAERVALTKEEADHTRSLEERDRYHDVADKLAQAIADRYKADIGEHSNINDPWQNALNLIEADNAAKDQTISDLRSEVESLSAIVKSGIDDVAGATIDDLEADNAALTARVKELDLQLSVSKETAKIKRVEYLDLDQDHSELKADYAVSEAQLKAARKALEATHEAISEFYRYQYGGEMRGSYDGKPERDGLWKAMYKARAALEAKP